LTNSNYDVVDIRLRLNFSLVLVSFERLSENIQTRMMVFGAAHKGVFDGDVVLYTVRFHLDPPDNTENHAFDGDSQSHIFAGVGLKNIRHGAATAILWMPAE
jgi:hypothetical protein